MSFFNVIKITFEEFRLLGWQNNTNGTPNLPLIYNMATNQTIVLNMTEMALGMYI